MKTIALLSLLMFVLEVRAAPAPKTVKPGDFIQVPKNTAVIGGRAGEPLSLIRIDTDLKPDSESIALGYGNRVGRTARGETGYFHLSFDRDGNRIVLDLAGITRTGVDPEELKKRLKVSKWITSVDMTMDPVDASTNLTINLNKAVHLNVRVLNEPVSSIILEMRDTVAVKK